MKKLLVAIPLLLLVIGNVHADSANQTGLSNKVVTSEPSQIEPKEDELQSHNHYKNKDGQITHSPAKSLSGSAPAGASAQCRDGSYSFSRHRSGTCSHHGGVATWF